MYDPQPTSARIVQSAALPYRVDGEGRFCFLLVTSLRSRRWIVPKGHVEPTLTSALSAANEAMEEAGVTGTISSRAIGLYHYDKRRTDGSTTRMPVRVFPLAVAVEHKRWPEERKRERRWFKLEEAIALVSEPELQAIMRDFAGEMTAQAA